MLLKLRHLVSLCAVALTLAATPQVVAKEGAVATGFAALSCSEFLGYAAEEKDAKWLVDMANNSGASFLSGINTFTEILEPSFGVKEMPEKDIYYWELKKECAKDPQSKVRLVFLQLWTSR